MHFSPNFGLPSKGCRTARRVCEPSEFVGTHLRFLLLDVMANAIADDLDTPAYLRQGRLDSIGIQHRRGRSDSGQAAIV